MSSASTSTTTSADIDLEGLIQSLPACRRCRECRRGCDTLLPKCRQCSKAGVDCYYYDHGRNEFLRRSHIADLVDHVRRLTNGSGSTSDPSSSVSGGTPQGIFQNAPASTEAPNSEGEPHYDHYFAYAGASYRYLGSESCLVKSPRLLSSPVTDPVEDDDDWQLSWTQSQAKAHELVEVYLKVIQPLYPIIDMSVRYLAPELPPDLSDTERFHLNMIYSIGCHIMPSQTHRNRPQQPERLSFQNGKHTKYQLFAASKFESAMYYLEPATSESTIDTLRSILLLTINSLFDPKSGNIGQQVALATRLALTLESQIPQEVGSKDAEAMRNMHLSIFSIENEIASTLDRLATFPEPEWELRFDNQRPAYYLCSLYRLQHRFRKGDCIAKEAAKKHLPALDDWSELLPGLRMALHQTHLLLNPCWGSAWYVLEAVVSLNNPYIFLTPHWVYRAGALLIEFMPQVYPEDVIQLYANALVALTLSSSRWPSSAALLTSLSDLMDEAKAKYPDWASRGRKHFEKLRLPT